MKYIASYLLSVTCAAIFAALIKGVFNRNTASGAMIHLLAGLLVVSTLIRPLLSLQMAELPELSEEVWIEADEAVQVGKETSGRQFYQVITQDLEAYILKEAQTYGASLTVCFPEEGSLPPEEVTISGRISPYARARLQEKIAKELGIEKEHQRWIG